MTAADAPAAAGAFHYDLPPALIAQEPAPRRGDARLLLLARGGGLAGERPVRDLPGLLRPGDLLVVNDSRVLPARLRARRPGGGAVELLLVEPAAPGRWRALARPARRLRPGDRLTLCAPGGGGAAAARAGAVADGGARGGSAAAPVVEIAASGDGGWVTVAAAPDPGVLAETWGEAPLPPYIRRGADAPPEIRARDRERYQTVYARASGSVAAPTAGLHFEPETLAALAARGVATAAVTLHVGPGTFRPPGPAALASGRLHAEAFAYPAATDAACRRARAAGGRIVAVGTTALRVLETVRGLGLEAPGPDVRRWAEGEGGPAPVFAGEARREEPGWRVEGRTRLFLRPPAAVAAADALLTNFHLPGSSLLMLVAAFTGEASWRAAYAHAVAARFRFYSYGDAMLIAPGLPEAAP